MSEEQEDEPQSQPAEPAEEPEELAPESDANEVNKRISGGSSLDLGFHEDENIHHHEHAQLEQPEHILPSEHSLHDPTLLNTSHKEIVAESANSPKGRHHKEETLVTMLELLAGNKDNVEVDEDVINEQKEKVEQMISELQSKMQQITLEDQLTPSSNEGEKENGLEGSKKSDMKPGTFKIIERDIVGQFDLTLGKVAGALANLFCPEKLQIVQIPANFIPRGAKTGSIITVSIARKKAEEEAKDKLIFDIQNAILAYDKSYINSAEEIKKIEK